MDEFFENEKSFLVEYNNKIKDATHKSDRMTKCHGGIVILIFFQSKFVKPQTFWFQWFIKKHFVDGNKVNIHYFINNWKFICKSNCIDACIYYLLVEVADSYIQISSGFVQLATVENTELDK